MQRGRPRLERDPNERVPMSTRIRGELFNRLNEVAEQNDRPLGHEVEMRLEASLREDDALGGSRVAALFRTLASLIESHRGDEWIDDRDLFNMIVDRWIRHFDAIRPKRAASDEEQLWAEYEEFKSLMQVSPGSQALRDRWQKVWRRGERR